MYFINRILTKVLCLDPFRGSLNQLERCRELFCYWGALMLAISSHCLVLIFLRDVPCSHVANDEVFSGVHMHDN